MALNLFRNKYPYTDFHELNLSWVISTVSDLIQKVDDLTVLVNSYENRVRTLETTTADLSSRMTAEEAKSAGFERRIGALEGADIMEAEMISGIGPTSRNASFVTIPYTKATYTDGAKTEAASNLAIEKATDSLCGVMVPEQKKKLDVFSIDNNGNATFSGRVAVGSPVGNKDATTKEYVDNMAISGSASPSTVANIINSWDLSNYYDPDVAGGDVALASFGSVYELIGRDIGGTVRNAISAGRAILSGTVLNTYRPARTLTIPAEVSYIVTDDRTYVTAHVSLMTTGLISVYLDAGTIPAGAEVSIDFDFTYINVNI